MPYMIVRDGDQYCVHKKTPDGSAGERMGCSDTRQAAQDSIAAMYANEGKAKYISSSVRVWREGGQRYMIVLASNAYRDREDEIVRQKALENYVQNFQPHGGFDFWHGGDPIGEIVDAKMMGPFLFELVKELPDAPIDVSRKGEERPYLTTVKALWDAIEKEPNGWGASIEFYYEKENKIDGVYQDILKSKTSILPRAAAANAITVSVLMKGENVS